MTSTTTSQQYGSSDNEAGLSSNQDQSAYGDVRGNLANDNDNVVRFLRERPAMALGAAGAVGFPVGRMPSRKLKSRSKLLCSLISATAFSAMLPACTDADVASGPCAGVQLPADQHFVADGLCVGAVATGQGELRQLFFAPNGDLFGVAVTGEVRRYRDLNGNGSFADNGEIIEWADTGGTNGHNVHIDTAAGYLYAGTSKGVKRWKYTAESNAGGPGEDVMMGQPTAGTHKYHPVHIYDGFMYVSSGSVNNIVAPMSPEYDTNRAVIKRFALSSFVPGQPLEWTAGEVFAKGLRNVVGFTRDSKGRLYGVMNGIDGLMYNGVDIHSDNPGDTLVLIEQGGSYGYPYCFSANKVLDGTNVIAPGTQLRAEATNKAEPVLPFSNPHDNAWCAANSTKPLTLFQPHSAPLDIAIFEGPDGSLPASYRGGAFVTLHGSWNSAASTGHSVVWVPFDAAGKPSLPTATATAVTYPHKVIFGGGTTSAHRDGVWSWSDGGRGETRVRPVGVAISPLDGALFVSSDNGRIVGVPSTSVPNGAIYRIAAKRK